MNDGFGRLKGRILTPLFVLAVLAALASAAPAPGRAGAAVLPVALAGLVAPVFCYRAYAARASRVLPAPGRDAAYRAAVARANGVQQAIAAVGVGVFYLSRQPQALLGLVGAFLVAGALWPIPSRRDLFGAPE